MSLDNNTIVHIDHSCFVMKLCDRVMVFDCASPANIDVSMLETENVSVFISHVHPDHFSRDIFLWERNVRDITFVLSHDIDPTPSPSMKSVTPGSEIEVNGCRVECHPSTDTGVAFSIFLEGRHIYFAGDNAWWNWDNEVPEEVYIEDVLSGIKKPVDIAFQVCDPRLEGYGNGGILTFASVLAPSLLVPIHAFGKYDINEKVRTRLKDAGFQGHFWPVRGQGDTFRIEL